MSSSLSRRIAIVAIALVVIVTTAGLATAESRAGGTVVVPAGETVDGGLEASGGTVVVHGTVNGNLQAFAGSVLVTGTVTGDVEAFAGSVRIDGRVGGDVGAFAGSVELGPEGAIGGQLEAAGGSIVVAGEVAGDARLVGESVLLAPTASVGGEVEYDAETFTRADGATVDGAVTHTRDLSVEPSVRGFAPPSIPGSAVAVYGVLVNLGLGIVLLLAFPGMSGRIAGRATGSPLDALGVGLLTVVAVPVALVLVAITIIGLPLALVGALLFGVVAWIGAVYGRFAVGVWLLSLGEYTNRWVALLAGVLLVGVVARLPVVGWLVTVVVTLVGLGALAHVVYVAYRVEPGIAQGPTGGEMPPG